MPNVLRIVVVDSDLESRSSLRKILGGTPGAVVVGEFGEVRQALLETPDRRPDLVLIEVATASAGRDGDASGETIRRFAEALPEAAILAMGNDVSAETVIKVIRAGAFEFLPRPVERVDLTAALDKITRVRRGPAPSARKTGRVVSVFSTKGGLGVTTVAINIAVCLAEKAPDNTLLIELDTRQSDIATFLDLRPTYSVLDAFENIDRLDESFLRGLLTRHSSGLWVLPGPLRMERTQLNGEQVRAGLEIIRSHFDNVVLDLRHDTSPGTFAGLEASDAIMFLTSLEVSALRSGAAGLAGFRLLGLDPHKIKVVVMREDTGEDVTVKHAREALGVPVYWRTPSDYQAVVSAINSGKPVVTAAPRSKFARNLRQLADMLTAAGPGPKGGTHASKRSTSLLGMVWNPKSLPGA
jgi:pilus assembly protein CpaE